MIVIDIVGFEFGSFMGDIYKEVSGKGYDEEEEEEDGDGEGEGRG